ncbi:PmoA family protein [Parafrankia sp. EUN1f]|uniref:DUF6807 domain-containing protein n=1 Tax=Parafrankia sp. EUN1f TaxID=102897 RepID=UPI0001C441E4|nr:PmoA family protein [Parafrankia sp. EUN1f]EFC86063.1 hypothetical protein FrEUN1fDRAFT_0853 [Parafrankia sp. EUN1f]
MQNEAVGAEPNTGLDGVLDGVLDVGRVAGPGGVEPAATGLGLAHELGRALTVSWRGRELFRYVYRPWEPRIESPRPYLHPLRTLGGDLVSLYRPHDHTWHKGISWSLSNVGAENFWGGRTYLRGAGYTQLDNNGTQRHVGFARLEATPAEVDVVEHLEWVTQAGGVLLTEERTLRVRAHPDLGAWQLTFATRMHNPADRTAADRAADDHTAGNATAGDATLAFGSPTTKGREAAGYSGLLWRGPRSFSGGPVVTPQGVGGNELMGWRGPWLGFVGKHDGAGTASTLVLVDHAANFCHPTRWFVRSDVFAAVCPAPFYDTEYGLAAGETLALGYDVLIADGPRDVEGCGLLVSRAG